MKLMEMILNSQNGEVVRQVADRFQLDESQTRSAVGALMPALTGAISRNASDPQGLDSLIGALARGNHSKYLEDPGKLAQPEAVAEGNGILGHLLGGKQASRELAGRAAADTGIDSGILKQMLPVLASAAMAAMSSSGVAAAGSKGASEGGDGGVAGMLLGFLDADKDGSVVDDLLGMAGRFLR